MVELRPFLWVTLNLNLKLALPWLEWEFQVAVMPAVGMPELWDTDFHFVPRAVSRAVDTLVLCSSGLAPSHCVSNLLLAREIRRETHVTNTAPHSGSASHRAGSFPSVGPSSMASALWGLKFMLTGKLTGVIR